MTRAPLAVLLGSFVLSTLVPSPTSAQEAPSSFQKATQPLFENKVVWVTDLKGVRQKGHVTRATRSSGAGPEGLSVLVGGTKIFFAADEIQQIEVAAERKRKMALVGLGVGAAVGAFIGSQSKPDFIFSQEVLIKIGAGLFGLIGAGVGAIAGATHLWGERVVYQAQPAAGKTRLTIAPVIDRRGQGLALTVRF